MDYLFLIKLSGFVVTLVIFSVRIERRLTRIEVDVTWIKKLLNGANCNVNLSCKEKEK